MKFIVDAQLPKSLSDFLCDKGHDSIHTLELPQRNKTKDNHINNISASENRVVVTKDNDFLESFLLVGKPHKLVFVTTGNIRNFDLIAIFQRHLDTIIQLLKENSLIEINRSELVVHS